jgi:hypothetical protein
MVKLMYYFEDSARFKARIMTKVKSRDNLSVRWRIG